MTTRACRRSRERRTCTTRRAVSDTGSEKNSRLGQLLIRMVLQGQRCGGFIYELERASEFVIIDDVTLTEGGKRGPDAAHRPATCTDYRLMASERQKQIVSRSLVLVLAGAIYRALDHKTRPRSLRLIRQVDPTARRAASRAIEAPDAAGSPGTRAHQADGGRTESLPLQSRKCPRRGSGAWACSAPTPPLPAGPPHATRTRAHHAEVHRRCRGD
jgi:hypothetical protein